MAQSNSIDTPFVPNSLNGEVIDGASSGSIVCVTVGSREKRETVAAPMKDEGFVINRVRNSHHRCCQEDLEVYCFTLYEKLH